MARKSIRVTGADGDEEAGHEKYTMTTQMTTQLSHLALVASEAPSYEGRAFVTTLYHDYLDNKRNLSQRFGLVVKRLRQNKRLSIRDVEERTSLSASYLYQIERGARNVPSASAITLLAEVYGVPFASLMAAAKYVDPEELALYYDQLDRAFRFVCQDKRFKYNLLVDEAAVPEGVKRFMVEMYQHFTGVKLLEKVGDKLELQERARRKSEGEAADAEEELPVSDTSESAT